MTSKEFGKILQDKLTSEYGVELNVASNQQIYRSLALICRQMMSENHKKFQSKAIGTGTKQVYYLCMEFLMGRSLKMSLFNLGLDEVAKKALADADINLDSIFEEEPDAGLGNGGLGRLAACYLDGMATTGICGTGYSILYEYGIFKQKIVDGWQQERADNWLPGGQVWLKSHPDQAVEVRFDGEIHENWDHGFHYIQHTNYNSVMAVPSDMYVQGYDGKGVAKLRLWQAKAPDFDMSSFSLGNYNTAMSKNASAELISKVLYPNDNHVEGKILRLRQQYFLSAASIGDIVQNHLSTYGTLENLPDKVAIQLNDTHPTLAIPEMMRILLDECGFGWDKSFDICQKVFSYTNHTVMPEALEKWDCNLVQQLLPAVYDIILRIEEQFMTEMYQKGVDKAQANRMKLVQNGMVHMAHIAVYASAHTNGVAAIHTEILKDSVLKDWYQVYPERFQNKTNGITQRRWLALCNPELSGLLTELLGSDDWKIRLDELKKLERYADDTAVLERFLAIKQTKKEQLAAYIAEKEGVQIDPNSIFDIQIKRLHEYKRQLLNAFSILYLYFGLKDGSIADITPVTFLFGAKSAPGYRRAKAIIKFIHEVAKLVEADPVVSQKIKVVFVSNYNVSYAEKLVAAADVSEQISTAGTEASGTGNMKLMLNGAVTLGTYDGANIEIVEEAGEENNYIFGAKVEELEKIMPTYDSRKLFSENAKIRRVVETLIDGTCCDGGSGDFRELYYSLLDGASWHTPDNYYLLGDLESYVAAKLRCNVDYTDRMAFAKKQWLNICNAGKFSSDRTIADYAENIWDIQPVKVD